MSELPLENGTEKPTENGAAHPQQFTPAVQSWTDGLPVRQPADSAEGDPTVPMTRWKDRDDFLFVCVRMGMNARQISLLSLSTPQPMRAQQHVYDKIESQGLARLYKSPRIKRRRQGFHNEKIIKTFMKLTGQAYECGHTVTEVLRDQSVEGTRFRPDLGLKIGRRQFYVEVQVSKIEYTRWRAKLSQYVKLYKQQGKPFRVLFLLSDDGAVTKVRSYARQLLATKGHPSLNIFLFMALDRFEHEWDVVTKPVWMGSWETRQRSALL